MREKINYEKPISSRLEKGKGEAYVFENFHQIGFKIEEMPELYERLIELASMERSHFEDAVKMAKIVDIIWEDLRHDSEIKFDQKELKLACLFHDIGKSGPKDANREQRRLVQMIYNTKYFNSKSGKFNILKGSPKDLTIEEAFEIESQMSAEEKEKIVTYLRTLTIHKYYPEIKKIKTEDLDPKKHKMIDIWREHDYWTWDLLKGYGNHVVTDDVKKVASTHHALEGHDPAAVDGFISGENVTLELLDKYLMITLLDKYQAWVKRAGISHGEAIKELESQIKESINAEIIDTKVAARFYKYLKIIEKYDGLPQLINQG
jgi:hypothetical protein